MLLLHGGVGKLLGQTFNMGSGYAFFFLHDGRFDGQGGWGRGLFFIPTGHLPTGHLEEGSIGAEGKDWDIQSYSGRCGEHKQSEYNNFSTFFGVR